jgi:hypothetical protein
LSEIKLKARQVMGFKKSETRKKLDKMKGAANEGRSK